MLGVRLLEQAEWNPNLFDDIVLPPKMKEQKQEIINQIMFDNFNLVCKYEEPGFFRAQVLHFFKSHLVEFTRLYETVIVDYNPIENYNRYENSHDEYKDVSKSNIKDSSANNGDNTDQVSAMNDSGFQNDRKNTYKNTSTYGRDSGGSFDHDDKFESHIHGNIGVTTTQQMIEAERKSVLFNIYQHISNTFAEDLLIRIY